MERGRRSNSSSGDSSGVTTARTCSTASATRTTATTTKEDRTTATTNKTTKTKTAAAAAAAAADVGDNISRRTTTGTSASKPKTSLSATTKTSEQEGKKQKKGAAVAKKKVAVAEKKKGATATGSSSSSSSSSPPPLPPFTLPDDFDVVCGRERQKAASLRHPGTVRYLQIVERHADEYGLVEAAEKRRSLVLSVVEESLLQAAAAAAAPSPQQEQQQQKPRGRFVRYDGRTGTWRRDGDDVVVEGGDDKDDEAEDDKTEEDDSSRYYNTVMIDLRKAAREKKVARLAGNAATAAAATAAAAAAAATAASSSEEEVGATTEDEPYVVDEPGARDVIVGSRRRQQKQRQQHPGNILYRDLVENRAARRYAEAKNNAEREAIVLSVLDDLFRESRGGSREGRFVRYDYRAKTWRGLDARKAYNKVAGDVRAAASALKKKEKATGGGGADGDTALATTAASPSEESASAGKKKRKKEDDPKNDDKEDVAEHQPRTGMTSCDSGGGGGIGDAERAENPAASKKQATRARSTKSRARVLVRPRGDDDGLCTRSGKRRRHGKIRDLQVVEDRAAEHQAGDGSPGFACRSSVGEKNGKAIAATANRDVASIGGVTKAVETEQGAASLGDTTTNSANLTTSTDDQSSRDIVELREEDVERATASYGSQQASPSRSYLPDSAGGTDMASSDGPLRGRYPRRERRRPSQSKQMQLSPARVETAVGNGVMASYGGRYPRRERQRPNQLVVTKHSPERTDTAVGGGTVASNNRSISATGDPNDDIFDAVGLDQLLANVGNDGLVFAEDRGQIDDVLFLVMALTKRCQLSAEDWNNHEHYKSLLKLGQVGICCAYCGKDNYEDGRYFPRSLNKLAYETSVDILNHVAECEECPQNVQNSVRELYRRRSTSSCSALAPKLRPLLPFFRKVWKRLHTDMGDVTTSNDEANVRISKTADNDDDVDCVKSIDGSRRSSRLAGNVVEPDDNDVLCRRQRKI